MNWEQLKKNIGYRVQLKPAAIRLDSYGRELPGRNEDWIIQSLTDTQARIDEATINGFTYLLGKDHIRNFTSNPARSVEGGLQYGFLTLLVQLYIQGNNITFQPCSKPGERVPPPPVQFTEKWVDSKYPTDSGLQAKLESTGYRLRWCSDSRLARLVDLEGWEVVVEKDGRGILTTLHLRTSPENQTLIKTRLPDLEALSARLNSLLRTTQAGFIECTVSHNPRALVFRFADPVNAMMFQRRMNGSPSSDMRYEHAPGRVDTVLGYVTE